MKNFERMTLKELRSFIAINKMIICTRGGDVFLPGTKFEIRNKYGGLELKEIGKRRFIRKVHISQLEFIHKSEWA